MNKLLSIGSGILLATVMTNASALTDEETLGKLIFFDANLSDPAVQSCASCTG